MTNMYINLLVAFSFFLLCPITAHGQMRFDPVVTDDGDEKTMPWTGGMNAPQFSNIDLNRDGIRDLVSFDRQGDILRTYLRLPASGRWIQSWEFEAFFPHLVDWLIVSDYDQDGVEDLFTSSSQTGVPGVTVYKGKYENETWSFELKPDRDKDYLQIPAGGGLANLYVSWEDVPAIQDVDGDGDLDILSFEPDGSYITYYQNQSVESGWGMDSLRFIVADFCWGKILENEINEEVFLSDNPDMCSDGNFLGEGHIETRHTGSTIAVFDPDFDNDLDALVGDISSRYLVFLRNGLNAEEAWITEQEIRFPANDTSVDIPYFIAAYFVELDDDPEEELLVAVNSRTLTEDRKSVWRYDDDPFTDGPLMYQLTQKGWLQDEMIDAGSYSRPAFADVNGDELIDLVVGGYHFSESAQSRIPSLWYFRNKGSITSPFFELVTNDFLGMSEFAALPTYDFFPAFGDMDANGSIDLMVGEQNGKLFFYKNISAEGDSMTFEPVIYPFMNIAVGVSATPQIADIIGDGLGDLVIGERTGNADMNGRCSNLNYFQNIGTPGNAAFNPDPAAAPNTACFGRVLFDLQIGLPQYSTPAIINTKDGLKMIIGSAPGYLQLYSDLQNGITGSVTLESDHLYGLDAGNRTSPALADLDHDGVYELAIGNQRGGIELVHTGIQVGTTGTGWQPEIVKPYQLKWDLHENRIEIVWQDQEGEIMLADVFGRILQTQITSPFSFDEYAPGIYFLLLGRDDKRWSEKLIRI